MSTPGSVPMTTDTPFPETAWLFAFQANRLVMQQNGDGQATLPQLAQLTRLTTIREPHFLGKMKTTDCVAVELVGDSALPAGFVAQPLRRLFGILPDEQFWIAGRASQILYWDRTHQFCGQCGQTTQLASSEQARTCPNCGHTSYPSVYPAIIVAVERAKKILLARSGRHPQGRFSVLAGFVEPGETLEECVRREIREEVGIEVQDIHYFGSQPWPFPNSLMIGFTCAYASGEIRPQPGEIEEADWFPATEMPRVPPKISISRALIDWFVTKHTGQPLLGHDW